MLAKSIGRAAAHRVCSLHPLHRSFSGGGGEQRERVSHDKLQSSRVKGERRGQLLRDGLPVCSRWLSCQLMKHIQSTDIVSHGVNDKDVCLSEKTATRRNHSQRCFDSFQSSYTINYCKTRPLQRCFLYSETVAENRLQGVMLLPSAKRAEQQRTDHTTQLPH